MKIEIDESITDGLLKQLLEDLANRQLWHINCPLNDKKVSSWNLEDIAYSIRMIDSINVIMRYHGWSEIPIMRGKSEYGQDFVPDVEQTMQWHHVKDTADAIIDTSRATNAELDGLINVLEKELKKGRKKPTPKKKKVVKKTKK